MYANEKIVGFYVLRRRSDHLYLDHLYVTPSSQGHG
ncbi:GNAT family N-acetyltransferase, partial [Dokdonella sp.]